MIYKLLQIYRVFEILIFIEIRKCKIDNIGIAQ